MVEVAHTAATFILAGCFAFIESLESSSMRLFRYQRLGDIDMTLSGIGRPVYVHNMVTVSFCELRWARLPVFWLCCFLFAA